ncbi:MAG: pantoate--beta-alanine ligase [Ilumatobacteraceae bacterium]
MIPVLRAPSEVRERVAMSRASGRTVGLVPTMGALHAGHAALIGRAAELTDDVIVSVFVNPLQFDDPGDLVRYPRDLRRDTDAAEAAGAAAVYAPSVEVMYPDGFDTTVLVDRTSAGLEGAARPGHFRGVATVVCKLLNTVSPDVAVFGRKDRQQLAVVARMVTDLDIPVRIVGHDTVREPDGLAMSSRNARLDPASRTVASVIPRALEAVRASFGRGERDSVRLLAQFSDVIAGEPDARLEYAALSDASDLSDVATVSGPAVLSCAVSVGGVRLIDNMDLEP